MIHSCSCQVPVQGDAGHQQYSEEHLCRHPIGGTSSTPRPVVLMPIPPLPSAGYPLSPDPCPPPLRPRPPLQPTDAMLQVCEESGRDLAKTIRKAKAQQAAKATALTSKAAAAATAAPVEQVRGGQPALHCGSGNSTGTGLTV